MSYAIIQLQGKQYRVNEGDTLEVDHNQTEDKLQVKEVLLASNGKDVKVGSPFVDKSSVTLEVVSRGKSDKIRVATFKAKSRSRRAIGHRHPTTTYKVTSIKI